MAGVLQEFQGYLQGFGRTHTWGGESGSVSTSGGIRPACTAAAAFTIALPWACSTANAQHPWRVANGGSHCATAGRGMHALLRMLACRNETCHVGWRRGWR